MNFWCEDTPKKLRTIQIGTRWFPEKPGGAARYYMDLVKALLKQEDVGVRGLVIGSEQSSLESEGRIRAFADEKASLVNRLYAARVMGGALIESYFPHVVATHFAMWAFPMLDHLRRVPHIVHFHGSWADESASGEGKSSFVKRRIEEAVYKRADAVICLSNACKELLINAYNVPDSKIAVIPGGVDFERFNTNLSLRGARGYLGLPQNRPIVLVTQRLEPRKGLPQLILAMKKVRVTEPDVYLIIAGEGSMRKDLEIFVIEHDMSEHVHFAGRLDNEELSLAYRAANISIVPSSQFEPFGLSILESFAASTPCLVTPVGGMPEIVKPISADLVLPDTDAHSIACGIKEWLNKEYYPGYRYANYVKTNFNWDTISKNIRSVYERAM